MYTYPAWGYGIGWLMALSSMLCIPLWIFIKLWKTEGTLPEVSSWRRKAGEAGSEWKGNGSRLLFGRCPSLNSARSTSVRFLD